MTTPATQRLARLSERKHAALEALKQGCTKPSPENFKP